MNGTGRPQLTVVACVWTQARKTVSRIHNSGHWVNFWAQASRIDAENRSLLATPFCSAEPVGTFVYCSSYALTPQKTGISLKFQPNRPYCCIGNRCLLMLRSSSAAGICTNVFGVWAVAPSRMALAPAASRDSVPKDYPKSLLLFP